ncbi:hypothetical protein Scep_019509 [Stephania cephalantha]|uniref:Uncharacterized protein n=1 Tax=Stephania cephalantha TaxID=152367 RepID=A0AAP0IBB1_9MAGN
MVYALGILRYLAKWIQSWAREIREKKFIHNKNVLFYRVSNKINILLSNNY